MLNINDLQNWQPDGATGLFRDTRDDTKKSVEVFVSSQTVTGWRGQLIYSY